MLCPSDDSVFQTTADMCIVLEPPPVGGIGKWKSSDQIRLLESFSDSDWSGHQVHRRSTSSGFHILNGAIISASSCTQPVVSLSSYEADLHSIISCLCDGIFLRRCIQFLTNSPCDHYLLVDSFSARQIATRQRPGKLKHFAGKLPWIQQSVRDEQIQIVQNPAAWNVSDLGTKPLGGGRIKVLLHMLNAANADGLEILGEEEYAVHFQKHGSMKQIKVLAKSHSSSSFDFGP
eukprot:s4681_g1.t2